MLILCFGKTLAVIVSLLILFQLMSIKMINYFSSLNFSITLDLFWFSEMMDDDGLCIFWVAEWNSFDKYQRAGKS